MTPRHPALVTHRLPALVTPRLFRGEALWGMPSIASDKGTAHVFRDRPHGLSPQPGGGRHHRARRACRWSGADGAGPFRPHGQQHQLRREWGPDRVLAFFPHPGAMDPTASDGVRRRGGVAPSRHCRAQSGVRVFPHGRSPGDRRCAHHGRVRRSFAASALRPGGVHVVFVGRR